MTSSILEVKDLIKKYGDTVAVNNISFGVKPNEILGLLGPNGAGKTTTISMLLGILESTAGSITIGGKDIKHERQAAIAQTNFAAVYAQLPGNLTVYENLKFFGLLYGVKNLEQRINQVIKDFDLENFRNTRTGVLSSGENTRVSLAKAMLNSPQLLMLDEPTASLDPSSAKIIREKIKNHATEGTGAILLTSHNMYEVAEVCDRVMFLSHGKILLEGDPKTLPREYGKQNLEELFITVAREPLSLEENQ